MTGFIKENKILVAVVVVVCSLFIVFFPQFYSSNDERNYIQNAFYLLNGGMVRNDVPCEPVGNETYGFFNGEGCVSKYNVGLAVILAPFVAINWQMSFVVTLAAYILGIYLFYLLLRYYKTPPMFLFLYALYPPLVYYAARPMSEIFSHTLILLIYYLLFVRQQSWRNSAYAGVVSGILVLIRYSNILLLMPLLLGWLYTKRKSLLKHKSHVIALGVSAIPFMLLFFLINLELYGSLIGSGYDFSGETFYFDPLTAVRQLGWYLLLSMAIYPGMVLLALRSRIKAKWIILFALLINFLLYVGFPGFTFRSGVLNFIIGYRFYIPILGLVLLLYFDSVHSLSTKLKENYYRYLLLIISVVLVAGAGGIHYVLYKTRSEYRQQSDDIYLVSQPGETVEGSQLLINEAFGKGIRYIEPEPWVPLDQRDDILINR